MVIMEVLEIAIMTFTITAICIVIFLSGTVTIRGIARAGSMTTLLSSIEHAITNPGIYTIRAVVNEPVRTIGNRLYIGNRVYTYRNVIFSGYIPRDCHIVKCVSYRVCNWNRCIVHVKLICIG